MNNRNGLTRIEVVVVTAALVLLAVNLQAISGGGRNIAKREVCLANLRTLAVAWQMYAHDNAGKFPAGWNGGTNWMVDFLPYFNWTENITLCPMATQLLSSIPGNVPGVFTAWGKYGDPNFFDGYIPFWARPGMYGSYGINGWAHDPLDTGATVNGIKLYDIPVTDRPKYWRNTNAPHPDKVPLFGDCMWDGGQPEATDAPPVYRGVYWGVSDMGMFCIDRHSAGNTAMTFMDGSARKVGLKELWRLKWHRNFNTNLQMDWPAWMQGFKDYPSE
jgi:hypothetical protein